MATVFFFWTMVLTQVIIIPNLRFFGSTVVFFLILEVSEFPIGLYCGWHISTNRNTNLWEIHSLLGFL